MTPKININSTTATTLKTVAVFAVHQNIITIMINTIANNTITVKYLKITTMVIKTAVITVMVTIIMVVTDQTTMPVIHMAAENIITTKAGTDIIVTPIINRSKDN